MKAPTPDAEAAEPNDTSACRCLSPVGEAREGADEWASVRRFSPTGVVADDEAPDEGALYGSSEDTDAVATAKMGTGRPTAGLSNRKSAPLAGAAAAGGEVVGENRLGVVLERFTSG